MYKSSVNNQDISCEKERERIESTFRLVSQYGHEINNQLTIIIGRSEQSMIAAQGNTLLNSYLEEICDSARRVADVTRKLLALRA